MSAVAAGWRAEIRRADREGVELVIAHDGGEQARIWFPTVIAAVSDSRGAQFEWRESRAIGSPTLYRGDLAPWDVGARIALERLGDAP